MIDTASTPTVRNEMILASAGSGKTYRLTNRYIRLLALGVAPERILALTFTRKAASEFLDEILRKLSLCASHPREAEKLREAMALDTFDANTARTLLRQVVDKMHLLSLGTLDSFFHRILSCFPAEFGLTSGFALMEDYERGRARRDVLSSLFEERDLHGPFTESFRRATYGAEEKSLVQKLDGFVNQYHSILVQAPDAKRWGGEAAIWPKGCPWLKATIDMPQAIATLQASMTSMDLDKKAVEMWDKFYEEMASLRPGVIRRYPSTVLKRLLEQYEGLAAGGPVTIKFNRSTCEFGPDLCSQLAKLLEYMMYCEVHPCMERTQGIFEVLTAFEERYQEQVRRAGKLGFDDVQLLLSGAFQPEDHDYLLSQEGGEARLNIDYRLDGQFDHWLLDEFQDTSLPQWRVVQNLVDEIVQDNSGERSFFYVGDVKQAIFGWRGGDSRLFHDIFNHYNVNGEDRILEGHMESSWRSGPVLLESVNHIFGNAGLLASMFPEHRSFVQRWNEVWRPHVSNFASRKDYFQLLQLPKAEYGSEPTAEEQRFEVVTQILKDLEPHKKNLSCAILVRRNGTAVELADYIRSKCDVPVVIDGDRMIGSDHPVAASFLALLQLALHPGDTTAWKHIAMTPAFAKVPGNQLKGIRTKLIESTLTMVYDQGFSGVFEDWLRRLRLGGFEADEFAERRIEQLRQVTRDFDLKGSRSIEEFIRFAQSLTSRESGAGGVVQIMTIHKSKGLGFDAVIVAELEGSRDEALTEIGALNLVPHRSGEGMGRDIDWVFAMPRKEACEMDPQLSAARLKLENEEAFEEMCVLYVALTRAKYANYVVCSEPGDKASARALVVGALTSASQDVAAPDPIEMGAQQVTVAYESGDADWYLHDPKFTKPRETETEDAPDAGAVPTKRRFLPLRRRLPSDLVTETGEAKSVGKYIFAPGAAYAADYGTKVHELFELVDFLDDFGRGELERTFNDFIDRDDKLQRDARAEVLRVLSSDEVTPVFKRDTFGPSVEIWKEKRFELVHEGDWISGTFDRVVFTRDANGKIDRACIYDFKTNRINNDHHLLETCEQYAPQMATYRIAISRLLNLDEANISSHLIFTRRSIIREVR